jgi:flavin reductase (DIM6/NTAB) family NADH-FMN oxidoreductase RutF
MFGREENVVKNKKQVGKALGRIASGLFVVTAKCEDKEDAVLASWVNQCSFDPPAVTIALGTLRAARLLVEGAGAFIVNVLPKDDMTLLKHFSRPPEDIFKGVKTRKGLEGIRILSDAVSYLECEVVQSMQSGDHVLYVGEIVGGKALKGGDPYIHVRDNGFNY